MKIEIDEEELLVKVLQTELNSLTTTRLRHAQLGADDWMHGKALVNAIEIVLMHYMPLREYKEFMND